MQALGYGCRFCIFLILLFGIATETLAADSFRPTVNPGGDPIYKSPSGVFDLYFDGYFQADFMALDNASPLDGSANWRAARPQIRFVLDQNWQWTFSYDFAISKLIDANLTYSGVPHFLFLVGQFSPVFGLENTSDTPAITFLELGLPVQLFNIDYSPGAEIGYYQDPFTVYASFFGPGIGTAYDGRAPLGGALSVSFSPIHTDTRVFYLSVSGWEQGTDSSHTINFSSIPEVTAANQGTLIDTGRSEERRVGKEGRSRW